MQTAITVDGPLRLGFFLERVGVYYPTWPTIPYRGLDRLPWIPSPELDPYLARHGHEEFAKLWDRYLDAVEDGTLSSNPELDRRMRRELLAESRELRSVAAELLAGPGGDLLAGVLDQDLEIVYAEVLALPDDLEQHREWSEVFASILGRRMPIHAELRQRPDGVGFLGCDLAYPSPPFHSAIFQPGLPRLVPNLPNYLNEHGLFPSPEAAGEIMPKANLLDSGWRPFCVLGVWVDET